LRFGGTIAGTPIGYQRNRTPSNLQVEGKVGVIRDEK
jgi:hypothetical protein